MLEGRVKLGAVTLNEMRDALGLDPYTNAAADRPMVLTATGYVPIEANADAQGLGAGGHGQAVKTDAPSDDVTVRKAAPDDPKHPGWPAGAPAGVGGQFRPKDGGESPSTTVPGVRAARANQSERDDQYNRDIITCSLVRTPLCYAQAMERYAACLAGKPILPLRF